MHNWCRHLLLLPCIKQAFGSYTLYKVLVGLGGGWWRAGTSGGVVGLGGGVLALAVVWWGSVVACWH